VLLLASALAYPIPSGETPVDPAPLASDWTTYVVDSEGLVGFSNSIAIDVNGIPHISYRKLVDGVDHLLKYATWTGTRWINETVHEGGGHSSIALDRRGNPYIGHQREFYADDRLALELILSRWNGEVWASEVVEPAPAVGSGISLALDGSDWPRMSYEEHPSLESRWHKLKQAAWTGSAWDIDVIDVVKDPDGTIGETSIMIDSFGSSHISYSTLEGDIWTLKYARSGENGWSIEVVDASGSVGVDNEMALDTQGRPHIGYYDKSNRDVKYAWWDGSAWNISVVDSKGWVGSHTSIALDGNDFPHMAYLDLGRQNPKYAFWNGSGWNFEIADSGWSFSEVHLALDSNSVPHLSYRDVSNRALRYATKAELPGPASTITLDIDPDTLNLKSEGRWVTAYLSAENASVHDVDISTILLQDILAPERWDYQDDVLMLKFNRQELITMLEVGESVEIKLSGKWEDGTAFEAYDIIRVINP
jgi:hypothetical protein